MTNIDELLEKAERDEAHSSVNHAEIVFSDESGAAGAFEFYVRSLRRIKSWNEVSELTQFDLFTEKGRKSSSDSIGEGHFIRISIKGSGKFDWVRVVTTQSLPAETVLTVKPTYDPTSNEVDESRISHFFGAEAENNFCLKRDGLKIDFYIIGLNEYENAAQTDGIIETVRNWITANFGSYLGMQKTQWSTFAQNFLETARK